MKFKAIQHDCYYLGIFLYLFSRYHYRDSCPRYRNIKAFNLPTLRMFHNY